MTFESPARWREQKEDEGMSMNAPEKVARQRLSVLHLAQTLGSVSEACRQRGMTRTQFYEYKRRFELQGLEGLHDLPPIHKTHPQTTPEAVVEQILALSLAHPAGGCVRLSAHLKLAGVSVSSPTIQDILIRAGMGRKFERLLKLEEQVATDGLELTAEQTRAVERGNPCFRERPVQSSRPGELLTADTYTCRQVQRDRHGLLAHGGGDLRLLRLGLPPYQQTARRCRRGAAP
jgi:Helix-turn-helix domain